jgi:hypothetical protein
MSPSVSLASNIITCATNSSDRAISSCGIAITPGHDPSVMGASTSIWGIVVMLGCSMPIMGTTRVLFSVYSADAVATTGGTILVCAAPTCF